MWARWFETANRVVQRDKYTDSSGEEIIISTVFLGIDHGFSFGRRLPVLWETMVFGGELDHEQCRYSSLNDARAGHGAMCARIAACIHPRLLPSPEVKEEGEE
jgi:hypothetical protein